MADELAGRSRRRPDLSAQRLLFLDIDGVLNSTTFFRSSRFLGSAKYRPPSRSLDLKEKVGLRALDPYAARRLERVLADTAAMIVLSSTWRYFYTPDEMQELLRAAGVPSAVVFGRTPHDVELTGPYAAYGTTANVHWPDSRHPHPRGYEIDQWLMHNGPVGSFAIVDDDDDMVALDPDRSEAIGSRFVRTNPEFGLRQNNAEQLVRLLSTPQPSVSAL